MFPLPLNRAKLPLRLAYGSALLLGLVLWLLPLAALMLTAMRSINEIHLGHYWRWPGWLAWQDNLRQVFDSSPMWQFLQNSLAITVPSVIGALFLSTLAGFALAKYRFRGNLWLLALFISGNFVPFQILLVPVRQSMIWLGLYDTVAGLVLFHMAFQVGFCTLFLRNFMQTIPDALLEAARLDGASEWRILFQVVLPLMRPALAALGVLVFTFVWNDYFWALVLTQSEAVQPITVGLQSLNGYWVAAWNLLSMAAILAALPPVLLFFTMQRHFIAGLSLGAVKQ